MAGEAAGAAGLHVYTGNEPANQLWVRDNERGDEIAAVMNDVAAVSTALNGKVNTTDVYSGSGSVFNKIPRYDSFGRLIAATPIAENQATPKGYVDAQIAAITPGTPDRIQSGVNWFGWQGSNWGSGNDLAIGGHIYVPNATAATVNYTNAFIDGAGRLCRGASSERFKRDIVRNAQTPDMFAAPFSSYVMREDPTNTVRYGYITQDLEKHESTRPFVVYDEEGHPISFDMMSFLFAQVIQLKREIDDLKGGA